MSWKLSDQSTDDRKIKTLYTIFFLPLSQEMAYLPKSAGITVVHCGIKRPYENVCCINKFVYVFEAVILILEFWR